MKHGQEIDQRDFLNLLFEDDYIYSMTLASFSWRVYYAHWMELSKLLVIGEIDEMEMHERLVDISKQIDSDKTTLADLAVELLKFQKGNT